MQTAVPLACFLSMIRPPGVQYENALLQIAPVDKSKCPYVKDNNDVGFQLFTRHNPTAFQELILGDDEKLFASNMDFNDKTVIYFHAWMEQPDDGSGIMVREAYMQRGDTNVIMVDAHHLEAGPWYFTAAQNTWYIGRFAGLFIDYLASRGLNLNNTHLVGHSLGAHAAGVAGSALKTGRVARITGLDPALPLFEHIPLEQRLDTTDAHFVDIIHTDAGIFGYKAPMGHVDFYPNGGISPQPGCELEVVLPKQLLLNKCDKTIQTRGFYSFYLTANRESHLKRKSLESKLENLFAFIQSVKAKDGNNGMKNGDGINVDKLDLKVNQKDKIRNVAPKTNINETSEVVNKEYEEFANKSNDTTNDSIKDLLAKEDLDETGDYIEDQIAEASEYDITHVEFNQDELKNNETGSLIKDNENIMEDTNKIFTYKHFKSNNRDVGGRSFSEEERDSTIKNDDDKQNNKRESVVTFLNYKDPCEPKTKKDHTTEHTKTSNEVTKILPEQINPKEIRDEPQKFNILNVLGTTYRISQVISTFKESKSSIKEKLKKLFTKERSQTTETPSLIQNLFLDKNRSNHVVKRQKRFLPFFRRSEEDSNNILFKMLDFLIKNRKNVLPVFTVMREINTLVKSSNGELNHITKEQNNYIGATPPTFPPITYNLELGNENRAVAFVKRLLGMSPKGDRLTINGRK